MLQKLFILIRGLSIDQSIFEPIKNPGNLINTPWKIIPKRRKKGEKVDKGILSFERALSLLKQYFTRKRKRVVVTLSLKVYILT